MEINTIIHGDCVEVLKGFETDSVDHVVTSPPYNYGESKEAKYKEYSDDKTPDEYFEFSKNIIDQLLRVTKHNIFYNIQLLSGNKVPLLKILGHYSENIKDIIIWDKMMAEPAFQKNCLNSQYEFIICFSKSNTTRMFHGGADFWGTIPNIVKISKQTANKFVELNKATFVEDVPGFFIKNFTAEGDVILDPFAGTFTTCIVTKNMKRKYIGIEISEELCELGKQRMRQDTLL